ncbi:hypothetical protein Tco_0665091 [Tanacetum coccineum]
MYNSPTQNGILLPSKQVYFSQVKWYTSPKQMVYFSKANVDDNAKPTSVCDDIDKPDAAADHNVKEEPSDIVEEPSDTANDVEHMDVNEPSKVCLKKEVNVSIACLSAADEVSKDAHDDVLKTLVDNIDVLMNDAHDTIIHADAPNHEIHITLRGGYLSIGEYRKGERCYKTTHFEEKQEVEGTLLQDCPPVIGKDRKDIQLDLTGASGATKKRIQVLKEVLDFLNQGHNPKHFFPCGTGYAIDKKFWQCLVEKDANRKGMGQSDMDCVYDVLLPDPVLKHVVPCSFRHGSTRYGLRIRRTPTRPRIEAFCAL